ncbi:DUF2283 domain-containing protein [Brevibacterium aurantiacum]|nr:DUF2283 domain-containing protein [Brevibacterium aurantiacum]
MNFDYTLDPDNQISYFSMGETDFQNRPVITLHSVSRNDPQVNVDFIEDGKFIGIEILAYEKYFSEDMLHKLSGGTAGNVTLPFLNDRLYFGEAESGSVEKEILLRSTLSDLEACCIFSDQGTLVAVELPEAVHF